jgi:hypothetical protein
MKTSKLILDFFKELSKEIKNVPNDFYDSFKYTKTGNNLTHPRTIGYILKVLWKLRDRITIDVDRRINEKGIKFQPDIFVNDRKDKPLLIIDYESPNSSDARIPKKDIEPYLIWVKSKMRIPYIIITTLPKCDTPSWELRYETSHRHKSKEIRSNPFKYWYDFYKRKLQRLKNQLNSVVFMNINGKELKIEKLFK